MTIINYFILSLVLIQVLVHTRDLKTKQFVRDFIVNEQKPTHLGYKLCWRKSVEISLVKEVVKVGVRSSTFLEATNYRDHQLLFLVDLSCPDFEQLISKAASRNLLRFPYRWLVIAEGTEGSSPELDLMRDSPLLADSDFVLAERIEEQYRLTELHKPSPEGPVVSTLRGFYNGNLVDVRAHRELFRRRRDVMGHPLTMANVIQDSNSTQVHLPREDRLEPQYDSISKMSWSNARLAFEMLNATPRYIFSHRFGYLQNGTWSGMIHELHTNRADVGTNCVIRKDRLDVITYTDTIAPFRLRFIFRQPPLSYVSNIFSLPFSTGVWVAIAVCTALSTASLYLASKWEHNIGEGPNQMDGSVGDAMLLAFSAISQQGCVMEPRKPSGRIITLVLFTALMALYAAYSANIVVLLQAPSSTIKTLGHLTRSKITLAAVDVDYSRFIFSMYKDPVRLEIYKKIDPEKGKQFYAVEEGTEKIRQGVFAFHSIVEPVYRRIEQTFLESEKCDLMEVDFLNDFDPSTPVRKGSPYSELLRVAFKQIREVGIRAAITNRAQVPKPQCSTKGAAFSSVGLLDLRPVLILMLYGIATSVIIALVEILVHKLYNTTNYDKCVTKTRRR